LIGFRRQILHVTDGTFELEVFRFLIQEIKKYFHLWYLKVAVANSIYKLLMPSDGKRLRLVNLLAFLVKDITLFRVINGYQFSDQQ
jgi:hypothetical protein